ncbi:hypothetical protein [Georgenia muralis]
MSIADRRARWRLVPRLHHVKKELRDLGADARRELQAQLGRLRSDPYYRNALAQGVLRGLLNALSGGPRATALWIVALVIELVVELLRALQPHPGGPATLDYA